MTTRADEETFVLSDEIIDHINSFFPSTDNCREKASQACRALQALINVIGILLCEIDCADCWELAIEAIETSFAPMLKDPPGVRANVAAEQREGGIRWVAGCRRAPVERRQA